MKETPIQNLGTLIAVGDIMLGDGPACAGHGVGSIARKMGINSIFKNVEPYIKKGDIMFGNLESVVSDKGIDSKQMKSFLMRAHPYTLKGLNFAGFKVLSLANNHSMQYGEDGLTETMANLSKNNIYYIGVGSNIDGARQPLLISIKGIKIAFLAYCLIPDKTAYVSTTKPEEIYSDVSRAKTIADVIIVSMHWGNEFIDIPSPYQIQFAHNIIDAGASLILGHHPHIVQGIEKYRNGLIMYSLGNFIFDVNYVVELRNSVILECRFSKNGIFDYELHPVYIDKYYCPIVLEGEEKTRALLKFKQLSLVLEKAANYSVQEYMKKVAERRKSVKRRQIIYFIRNIYHYPWKYTWNTIIQYLKKNLV